MIKRLLGIGLSTLTVVPILAFIGGMTYLVAQRIPPESKTQLYVAPVQIAPTLERVKPARFEPTARDNSLKGDRMYRRTFDPSIFAGCDPLVPNYNGDVCGRGKG